MKFKIYLFYILFVLGVICVGSINLPHLNNNLIHSSVANENTVLLGKLNQNSTIFPQLALNNTHPSPSQAVNVSSVIYDPAGVKNASLFWSYNSINSTLLNTTMQFRSVKRDTTGFYTTTTGYLFPNGSVSLASTNLSFISYYIELNDSTYLSSFTASIAKSGGNNLAYIKIESKLYKSFTWNTIYEDGNFSTTLSSPVNFVDYNVTTGYKVFAVDYKSKSATGPSLTTNANTEFYSAVIPPSNKPSEVSYYLKAFNNLNNVSQSSNNVFVMNSPLTFSSIKIPSKIISNEISVNISVTDPDGVDWINQNSVIAYYGIINKTNFGSTSLSLLSNESLTTQVYSANINVTLFRSNAENNLTIYFEAKDLIPGYAPSAIKSSSFMITLVADPSLPPLSTTSFNSTSSSLIDSSSTSNLINNGTSLDIIGPLLILGVIGAVAGAGGGLFYYTRKKNIDLASKGKLTFVKAKEQFGKTAEKIKSKRPKKEGK